MAPRKKQRRRVAVSMNERLDAARRIRDLADAYLARGGRPGATARALEPLLDHVVREYRREQLPDETKRRLASAAWQVLWRLEELRDSQLDHMLRNVAKIRSRFDRNDDWLARRTAVGARDEVRRIAALPKMREETRAKKLFEFFSESFWRPDSRRGLRPSEKDLLLIARDTAALIVTKKDA